MYHILAIAANNPPGTLPFTQGRPNCRSPHSFHAPPAGVREPFVGLLPAGIFDRSYSHGRWWRDRSPSKTFSLSTHTHNPSLHFPLVFHIFLHAHSQPARHSHPQNTHCLRPQSTQRFCIFSPCPEASPFPLKTSTSPLFFPRSFPQFATHFPQPAQPLITPAFSPFCQSTRPFPPLYRKPNRPEHSQSSQGRSNRHSHRSRGFLPTHFPTGFPHLSPVSQHRHGQTIQPAPQPLRSNAYHHHILPSQPLVFHHTPFLFADVSHRFSTYHPWPSATQKRQHKTSPLSHSGKRGCDVPVHYLKPVSLAVRPQRTTPGTSQRMRISGACSSVTR